MEIMWCPFAPWVWQTLVREGRRPAVGRVAPVRVESSNQELIILGHTPRIVLPHRWLDVMRVHLDKVGQQIRRDLVFQFLMHPASARVILIISGACGSYGVDGLARIADIRGAGCGFGCYLAPGAARHNTRASVCGPDLSNRARPSYCAITGARPLLYTF